MRRLEQAQQADFRSANQRSSGRGAEAPGWLKGVAHAADSGGLGGPQHRPEHSGKHVGVLVRIDVGERDASGLKQGDLRGGFGFYPGGMNAPGEKPLEKCVQRGLEATRAPVHQCGQLRRGKDRLPIHENHVAADAQRGCPAGHLDGFLSGCGPGHQRGAGQRSGAVQLEDGAVDPGGQPKIVGIEDKTAHRASLSTRGQAPLEISAIA